MYRAFTGALALGLTLLVLHWAFPELADAVVETALKAVHLIGVIIDNTAAQVPAR